MPDKNRIDLESGYLKAIAQPTRLKILYFLRAGERCACEIIPELGGDQSNISRHLNFLKNAGVLDSRKEGVSIYYKIKDKRVFSILSTVDSILKSQVKQDARVMDVL
jgi:ArsR family transcriptional regulator